MLHTKYVKYARYSSDNQKPSSIEDQFRSCDEFGISRGWACITDYKDEAKDGKAISHRPSLLALLELVEKDEADFKYILIEDTSRLSRDIVDLLSLVRRFAFRNIFIYFVNQHIDTSDPNAELLLIVHGIVDSNSNKKRADETFRGMRGRVEKGFSSGGRTYGYRTEPVYDSGSSGKLAGYERIINPDEAKIVRYIFEVYAERRLGYKGIAKSLNETLIKMNAPLPPSGKYWSHGTIRSILRNSLYRGIYIWNKSRIVRDPRDQKKKSVPKHPNEWKRIECPELRIVSDELWEKAQIASAHLNVCASQTKALLSENLLTGILKCGQCSGNFVITSGGSRAEYGCSNHWNKGGAVCKSGYQIDKEYLEEAVIHFLSQELIRSEHVETIFSSTILALESYHKDILQMVQNSNNSDSLECIKKQISNLLTAITSGIYDSSFRIEFKRLRKKEADLTNLINLLPIDAETLSEYLFREDIATFVEGLVRQLIDPLSSRSTLLQIVDQILVSDKPSGQIQLQLVENINYYADFALRRISERCPSIRYKTGTRFIPYTPRVFHLQLDPVAVRTRRSSSGQKA